MLKYCLYICIVRNRRENHANALMLFNMKNLNDINMYKKQVNLRHLSIYFTWRINKWRINKLKYYSKWSLNHSNFLMKYVHIHIIYYSDSKHNI